MPYDTIDPVPVACEAVSALQGFIARRTPFFDPAIISVTSIHAGSAYNVVPPCVELKGTLRTLSDERREQGRAAFRRIVEQVAAAHECTAEVRIDEGYPATRNDPRAVRIVESVASDLFGADQFAEMPTPIMGGEDFAYVLREIPGAMAFLGVAPPGEEAAGRAPIHNGRMTVHEDWLQRGVAMHCALATRFLASGWE
jgi:hippurate hydrolase